MTTQAIIFVNDAAEDHSAMPRSLLKVGGITLLERQLRQLKRLGINKVRLISRDFLEGLQQVRFKNAPDTLEFVPQKRLPANELWNKSDNVLLVEEGVLIDERIYKSILAAKQKRIIATYPGDVVLTNKGLGLKLRTKSMELLFASVALVKGEDIIKASSDREFQSQPVRSVLKAALGTGKASFKDISKMKTYLPDRRREVDILWRPLASNNETGKATRVLIGMAQKGVLDWPARWIHPFFENFLVEIFCPTPITPNFITLVTAVVGFAVTYLFATGHMMLALIGALIIGVLDGVDGKLARTKMLQSKIGELEHLADKVVEYSWYFGIAWYLAGSLGNALPWALAIIIVLFAWAEVLQGEFFRRFTGKQLDDAGAFERAFRIVGGRRNTQIWALIPFALLDQWLVGFWVIAIYAAITFFVAQARFIIRLRDYGSEKSLEIKKNISDTAYF